jgi:hypothetical protein
MHGSTRSFVLDSGDARSGVRTSTFRPSEWEQRGGSELLRAQSEEVFVATDSTGCIFRGRAHVVLSQSAILQYAAHEVCRFGPLSPYHVTNSCTKEAVQAATARRLLAPWVLQKLGRTKDPFCTGP